MLWQEMYRQWFSLKNKYFNLTLVQIYCNFKNNPHFFFIIRLKNYFEYKSAYFFKWTQNKHATKKIKYERFSHGIEFEGRIFQQDVDIPNGNKCSSLHADLFLFQYESQFIQTVINTKFLGQLDRLMSQTCIFSWFFFR